MAELNAKAAEMFAAGESVNAVAKALFSGAWAKAKQQHGLWMEQQGGATEVEAAPEAEAAAPDAWDLSLAVTVPVKRLVPMFKAFSAGEQANAVQYVLQQRLETAAGGE